MKKRFDRLRSASLAGAVAVLLWAVPSRADGPWVLRGHVPAAVADLQPVSRLDATNRLHLAVGLPLRNSAALATLLRQIYDPASPNFHHYLTPAQFTDAFGPSEADYQAVAAFFKSSHWAVTAVHPNRVILDMEASVADVEKVLHVTLRVYNHPTEHRTFFAPDTEPSLDVNLPVLHISGLDNYLRPHPNYKAAPVGQLGPNQPALGSGPGGTYWGNDFRAAYVPGVTLDGSGQKVALFEFDGYFPTDIAQYESDAGLPAVVLTNVLIDGYSGAAGSGNGEVALDIEMLVSMAPGLSQIIVYEAANVAQFGNETDDMLNRIATDNLAHQISASWTYPIEPITEQIYLEFQAQGQSFFNSAGDSGAYPLGKVPTPAGDTNITIVGGTTLFTLGPGGPWQSETVWSWFTAGTGTSASSGGIDTNNAIPLWQQNVNMSLNNGSTVYRNLPDVALTADNIFVVADNGQPQTVGGTSAATPLWAAFASLVNEQAFTSGKPPIGFINPAVYAIGTGPQYGYTFHDIITGNNTNLVSSNLFYAVAGYDLCTGWGTPAGSNLINALAPIVLTPVLIVATNIITGGNGNGLVDFDECDNLTIVLTNVGGAPATSVQGFLSSLTTGVIVAQGSSAFENIPVHGEAVNLSPYTISTETSFVCGTPVKLMLVVKTAQVIQTNYLQLPSGTLGSPVTFSSQTPTNISITNLTGSYSPITVSNLESLGNLTVSVYITSQSDIALSIELISPNGTNVELSENNGGTGQNYGSGCSPDSATTFDDAAVIPITAGTPPYIGSFSPQQPLSAFNLLSGTNLNGVWLLHVFNQSGFPYPATLQCWSLNMSPYLCTDGGGECPGANLSLTMSASPNPVVIDSNLVFNLVVSNAGPSTATGVVITQTLPPGVGFVAVTNYEAGVNQIGSNLDLTLGAIPVYGTAVLAVVTIPTVAGLVTSYATVGSPAPNSNPSAATASASAQVTLPTADLAVTMAASPNSVLQGGPLTYTIAVTNNGPFLAQQVLLSNSLPPNVNFLSATTTQGTIGPGASTVQIGTLDPGSSAIVTITVSPTITGDLTVSTVVSLSPLETDPDSFNNAASVTVTVGPSADLGVSAVATPPGTVLSGSNVTVVATVVNNGPSAATSVVFSQTVPPGVSFVSSSQPGVTLVNGVITWDIGSLSSGSGTVITNVLQAPTLLSGVRSNLISSSLTVFGQPGDAVTNNNTFILQELVEPPTVTIVPAGAALTQPATGNGSVNPQESVEVQFNLRNTGNISTTNLVATLQAGGGVVFPSGAQAYGALAPGGAATGRLFTFTADSTNGGTVMATLQLQDGSANLGSATFLFVMPAVATFWNTNDIDVPSRQFVPQPESGPANPYPSTILVSNVSGLVSAVSVTISNMTHSYPHDVGMMLIGPTGLASALMMSAADYSSMSGVTFTIDPNATVPLPPMGYIVSGSYLPEIYSPSFFFTNAPVTNPVVNLTGFDGLSPNGTWSLYVYDGVNEDAGGISNGWGLTITTLSPVNPVSDLVAGLVASANQVVVGNSITYLLSVKNDSASSSSTVYLTNVLSPGLAFVSSSVAPGAYTQNGQTTIFSLGSLAPGASLTITNVVTATVAGSQTNTIYAGSGLPAGNAGNNEAGVVIPVSLPFADVGAFISIPTNHVVVASNLVYTLFVTNYGPSNAAGVVGSFSLAGLNLVSAPANAVSNNGVVRFNFGTIPAGDTISAVITTAPPAAVTLTNVWSVTTTDNDPNPANNSTNAVITVTYPFPNITAGGVTLLTPTTNGGINSGQSVTVALTLNNIGSGSTTNLVATLLPIAGITPGALSRETYGVIPPGGSGVQSFSFTASGGSGAEVVATLALADGSNSLGSVVYVFYLPLTTNYSNGGSPIIIPDFGPATPYPSPIQVAGVRGLVSKVTATLNGFTHTYPHDVSVLLASPAGQELLLMSRVGGPFSVTNVIITFDDAATQYLPTTQLTNGTYLPTTTVPPFTSFPGIPTPTAAAALAIFDGTNPNGEWSLYVYDDTPGNDGIISSGWSLGLTAVSTINPAARLEAGMVHIPDPVYVGNFLEYQISITNLGPDDATSVVLTDILPASLTFSSAAVSQGAATNAGNTVTVNFGTLIPGAVVTAAIRVVAVVPGTVVNTVTVSTASTDLYLADSTVSNTGTVDGSLFSFLSATNTAGGLQLTLRGQPSQNYGIQISTNLLTWTTISTNTANLSGVFIYTDPQRNAPARFYRVFQLSQ
jgi:uncharacterized repeat protein (TIGR01451 family)